MVRLKNRSKGFTIVELLIVIVVIGILATLVIVTFTGIQQKARDSKRKNDVAAVQATLETYYSSNNSFPSLTNFNSSTWRSSNLKGFDSNALYDPKLPTSEQNAPLKGTTDATHYGYAVTGCDTNGDNCANYTITATLESGGTTSKQSNN